MKSKLIPVLALLFLCTQKSYSQYKDLEGVFFGKVIALGVGGSVQSYKDKLIGSNTSITPLYYSVFIDNKKVSTMRLALHKKFNLVYAGNDGMTDYTQTHDYKFVEFEMGYQVGLTKDGIGKPFSVFLNLQIGILFGNQKINDSRWGEMSDGPLRRFLAGGGLTLYQRLGSRFMAFAEPTYRFDLSEKVYFGDNYDRTLKFNHFNGHAGILFLIGKQE